MPRVVIVNPDVKSLLGIRRGRPWMAPGALTEIGAMVTPDWSVVAWDEAVEGPIPEELIQSSDLLALSFLTPSRYRALDLAMIAKKLGVNLIAGGRDVIGWSREANGMSELQEHFPSVCTTTLSPDLMNEILVDASNNRLKTNYQLSSSETVRMVMPRRDLINPKRYFAGYTIRSSEGCNLSCPWCTVGGRGYYFKDPAILEAELRTIPGGFFLDNADSFAGNSDFVFDEILPQYAKSGKKWGTEIAVTDVLGLRSGRNLVEPMANSGCRLLYFGIESVTRDLNTNKSSRKLAEQAILECRRAGILTIGALILDVFGDETIAEIEEMVAWASKWLDFAQFSLVAALPGCALRRKAIREGKIINQEHENWELYDGANPTIEHTLSPQVRRKMWRKAYFDFSRFDRVLTRAMHAKGIYKLGLLAAGMRYRQDIPKV